MEDIGLSITILAISAITGLMLAVHLLRRHRAILSISGLVMLNYTLTQPVSGIAHLISPGITNRGFFDLLANSSSVLMTATMAATIGLVGLTAGCLLGLRRNPPGAYSADTFWMGSVDKIIVSVILLLMFPAALIGMIQIRQYAEESGLDRIISVGAGLARYAFLAQWMAWVITLGVLLIAGGRRSLGQIPSLIITAIGVILIAAVLSWTGGRSIILVMTLPLILLMLPRFERYALPSLIIGVVALLIYASIISEARMATYNYQDISYFSWLDWESGRFSMSGFAAREIDARGLLWGETYLNALSLIVGAPLKLMGVNVDNLRSSSDIAGYALLRSDQIYIVPGMTAELMLNFGLAGVALGYFLLGWITARLDSAISRSHSVFKRLALCFVGSVMVFRTIQSDSSALPSFLFFIGAPLIACWIIGELVTRRYRRRRPSRIIHSLRTSHDHLPLPESVSPGPSRDN